MNFADQYRALVVDDEAIVRQATIRALSRAGFTCEAAGDGAIALEMTRQSRYDLVLTDLRMPEANGHQLATELLASPSRPAIVVLTGVVEPRLAKDLRVRGVDEILFKPIDYDILAKKVREIVERHAATVQQAITSNAASLNSAANGTPMASMASQEAPRESACPDPADPHSNKANVSSRESRSTTEPDGRLTVGDLARAVELNPSFAAEIARFAKQKYPNTSQTPRQPQPAAIAAQKAASVWAVCTFAAGIVVGWTLSWLGLALFR